jgi:Rrf2 family protein
MMITSGAYFGVEALARLAAYDADRPCPTESPAGSINCSRSFTEQLMAQLRAAGLAKAAHGRRTSYYRPAHRITVAEVIRAFGEPHNLDHRPLALRGLSDLEVNELGGTDLLWEALNSYILLFLEGVSRADIVPATDAPLPNHMGHTVH